MKAGVSFFAVALGSNLKFRFALLAAASNLAWRSSSSRFQRAMNSDLGMKSSSSSSESHSSLIAFFKRSFRRSALVFPPNWPKKPLPLELLASDDGLKLGVNPVEAGAADEPKFGLNPPAPADSVVFCSAVKLDGLAAADAVG